MKLAHQLERRVRRATARVARGPRTPAPALSRYDPWSTLELPTTVVPAARFAAIDIHNHLGRWLAPHGRWMVEDVPALVDEMAATNIAAVVNLDGRWGAELSENIERYDEAFPGRFATFCHVDWSVCRRGQFEKLATDFTQSVDRGAKGLKVWKDLGRSVRDERGQLVLPGDPRLVALWEAVAHADVPVLIHVADPVAHFSPVDRHNERLEELRRFPGASWLRGDLPSHAALIESLVGLVDANPSVSFIAAHVAGWSENLGWVDRLLERPNVWIDISARVGDLGRQPRAARRLLQARPDRVLFGTDVYPFRTEEVGIYFRFLETEDEAFPYSVATPPPRGRWTISGLGLDDALLRAVYRDNARRLVPSLTAGGAG